MSRIARSNRAAASGSSGGTPKHAPSLKTNPSREALYALPQPAACTPVACAESASGRSACGDGAWEDARREQCDIPRDAAAKHRAWSASAAASRRTHAMPLAMRRSTIASASESRRRSGEASPGEGSHDGGGGDDGRGDDGEGDGGGPDAVPDELPMTSLDGETAPRGRRGVTETKTSAAAVKVRRQHERSSGKFARAARFSRFSRH